MFEENAGGVKMLQCRENSRQIVVVQHLDERIGFF